MNRSIFLKKKNNTKSIKQMNLNFGPQHPAAHGVLRLVLQINGEIIEKVDPHIGLLHRGTEKLIESKNYLHSIPYFDRLDYVSMLIQEHAYCLAIENLMQATQYTSIIVKVRTLYDELTRILNHLLAVACHALDVGSMSPVFWAFEEREKILEFYERISGARMHAVFYRPLVVNISVITKTLIKDIIFFTENSYTTINEINNILIFNKLWRQRLIGLGIYNKNIAINYGLTGVMARCVGLKRDLRVNIFNSYAFYFFLNFKSYISLNGDSYDRYLLRIIEMLESLNIINQITFKFLKKTTKIKQLNKLIFNYDNLIKKNNKFVSMESVIKHFKFWSEGMIVNQNITYASVESPKGEFGVTLISDNTNKPYKCKIRSPAYFHLQILPFLTSGLLIADLVTLIGTIDIVFGEIDR